MDRRMTGVLGEVEAAKLYRREGYEILASDFRTRMGEVDLIAGRGSDLVFAEVKTRAEGSLALPREAVTAEKQRKIAAAAGEYISKTGAGDRFIHFDVIEVYIRGERVTRTERIPDAFTAQEG